MLPFRNACQIAQFVRAILHPCPSLCIRGFLLLLLFATAPLQAQIVETHTFANLNRSIPDGKATGLSDVQSISSAISSISSLSVKLRIAGEFNGDLYGYIRHTRGGVTNFCVLLNRPGRTAANPAGYADSGLDITFDDTAPKDIQLYQATLTPAAGSPLTGVWRPDGRKVDPAAILDTTPRTTTLGSFAGAGANGDWTLFLADLESGGTNMLVSWELNVTGSAIPVITWATPSDIVYGTALGGSQLNASANVPGSFSYSPSSGTVLNAGSAQTLAVAFIPSDTAHYAPVSASVSLNVLPATVTATLASSANPQLPGQPVSFTFTASAAAPGAGDPAGSVQFKIDGANAELPVALASGIASFSISTLALGSHAVRAEYSGSSNFIGVTNTLTPDQIINTPPVASPDKIQRWPTNGVKVSIASLLSNDTDPDGDTVTFISFSPSSPHGATVTRSGGWLFYTPPPGFIDADTFTYSITDGRGAPVSGVVAVNLKTDSVPSPNLTIWGPDTNGTFTLQFDGIPGQTYRIQYADDPGLQSWQPLGTATADPSGLLQVTDTPPADAPRRYYRSAYP